MDVRANAIAKLKRAASQPRNREARRPAGDGQQPDDGDAPGAGAVDPARSLSPTPGPAPAVEPTPAEPDPVEPEPEPQPEPELELTATAIADEMAVEAEMDPESDAAAATATPAKKRTRSRSRSRSKQRPKDASSAGNQSGSSRPPSRQVLSGPTTPPLPPVSPVLTPALGQHRRNLSSLDNEELSAPEPLEALTDAPSSLPAFDHPPPLANILTTPPVARALSPFAFNPANAPSPVMSAGPSLSAIQSYLQRSNSAAARQNALHKLTGGRMDFDDVPSPSPPLAAPNVALNRSNTFAGGNGERKALKQAMMQRLAARQPTGPDAETSGEEIVVPMSPSPRRRRRSHRPKRDPSIVDDREPGPALTPGPSAPTTPAPGGPVPLSRLPSNQSLLDGNDYRGPSPAVSTTHLLERDRDSALARLVGEDHFEFDKIARAASRSRNRSRGPVIEDEYGEDYVRNYGPSPSARPAQSPQSNRPSPSPKHLTVALSRIPNLSDEPTFTTFDSLADRHPVYIPDPSLPSPYQQDVFPQSPFGTPMKELNASDIEFDATQDLHNGSNGAGLIVPWTGTTRQNIPSWQTFPEPTYDRVSESEDELASPIDTNADDNQLGIDDAVDYGQINSTSYRDDLVIHVGDTPVLVSDQDIGPSRRDTPAGDRQQELTPPLSETRPESVSANWEDLDPANERTPQHLTAPPMSPTPPPSTWDKLKATITRSDGPTSPTASRSASRAAARSAHVSQLSTNSTASSSSGRAAADASPQQYVSLTQNSSAADSTTMLAIPLPLPSPASFTSTSSPMPPASPADRAKYADSKLQPFPALAAMARRRGMSISHSTPDVSMMSTTTASGRQTPVSPMVAHFDDSERPGLVHQASDSKLLARYQQHTPTSPGPPATFGPHSGRQGLQDLSHMEYIDLPVSPQQKSAPGTKSGRFKWVQKMRGNSQSTIPVEELRKQRKPSFADLLSFKKPEANGHSRQISNPIFVSDPVHAANTFQSGAYQHTQEASPVDAPGSRQTPRDMHNGRAPLSRFGSDETAPSSSDIMPRTSQSDALLDSSAEDSMHSAARSTTESFASPHSERSNSGFGFNSKPSGSMLRFEQLINSGALKMMESPPRKLLYMSAVSQVVNVNSVKSRVLFLFNDILVLAQPAAEDESPSAAGARQLLDRKYEIRNVIELFRMRYCSGRDEPSELDPGKGIVPRHSDVQLFIREFTTDPEQAVEWICSLAGIGDNVIALGRFLFETVELERVALGRYLADRANRTLLKAFIDCFGFAGVRVDTALRIFLLGLGLPADDPPATEMLLGVFAGRWFDLNSGLVSYDKELTARLVRSIVSLNDALHPDAEDMYYGHYQPPPSPQISARHFIEACRQYDPSALIGDDVLAGIYRSILMERLRYPGASIYRHSRGSGPPSQIKAEGLPTRLTYRVPSEPIRVRISYPDPQFIVHLQGKDLLFDPPVLQFDRSREATFRVTGTSLGVKSIIMYCAGSRASEYSGLPLSTNVNIERAYMKPVFQIAFPSHHGIRRYMFSVDDANILQDWMQLLQLHVSTAAAAQQNRSPNDADALYRAAEVVAVEAMRACIGSTYRGHELVILAQQNSVIPSVLSMLRGA